NIWWCARFGRGTWSTSSPSLLPSWIASLTSPSTRSFPASSTELGGHTVFSRPACATPSSRPTSTRWSSSNSASPFRRLRRPPDIGTGGRVGFVGVQLPEFDVRRDPTRRTPSTCSAQWHRLRPAPYGIDSGQFAAHLHRSTLVAHCRFCRPHSTRWIAFHSCYDFAYLIKVLGFGRPLPNTLEEFLGLVNLLFGETVDLKHMMRGCKGLRRVEKVASTLGVPRQAGKSHQLDQIAW
ncbi:unnamed protein product, partial [Musa acuminata subsp. burmannicoides]